MTSDDPSGQSAPTQIPAATDTLIREIEANRHHSEAQRRLAPAIVSGIQAGSLQRLMLPAADGGLEAPLPTALDVYERLAGSDPSVAWVVWNNALPCLFSRFLKPEVRRQIFAEPQWLHASSTRPSGKAERTEAGFRLNGRWSLVSGCELAEWMPLTGLVAPEGGGPPEMHYFFMHRAEVEILDTWHVGGLRGTGSHDVVVADALVPEAHSLSPTDESTAAGPYGRLPIIATLSLGMAAQFLGIGRAALAATTARAQSAITETPVPDMRDRPDVQAGVAGQRAALDAARAHLHGQASRLWAQAQTDAAFEPADIAPVFAASAHAIGSATAAVDALYSLTGTAAIYQDNPLERLSRDLRVMRQHVLAQPLWPEQAGRVMLGLPANNPLFAV